MHEEDVFLINQTPPWLNVQDPKEKFRDYFQEQSRAVRQVGIVERGNEIIGYGSLLFQPKYPHFQGVPEIHDLLIFEEYRGFGAGRQLISWLEEQARVGGYKEVGIGVGLYAEYGTAQRLYFSLGYRPDGYGVSYKYQPIAPGKSYPLDDDLILWLKKRLC